MKYDDFLEYLKTEKKMAPNSLQAYRRDIRDFEKFAKERGTADILETSSTDVVAYLHHMKADGKSPATANRKMASLRSYFTFLVDNRRMESNPTAGIKTPKIEKKELEFLTINEVDRLMESPDDSHKGLRDRAILELLYATGIKVSELIDANLEDVNFRMGFITLNGKGNKTRIVPMGRPARAALENYVYDVRSLMLKGNKDEPALFVNVYGNRITRQGLWKILKEYGEKTGLENKLTPNVIRNSFAIHMLQNGADLKSLQELMGSEDISAIQVYLAATKNRIKEVYDRTHPRA